MAEKSSINPADLLHILFRSSDKELPFDEIFGEWYVFLNHERGIATTRNKDHRWLRICGIRISSKNGVQFDSEVEPIFLRTKNTGEPPNAIFHSAHPHAKPDGCVLNLDAFVWLNVNRSMEPNIRDYVRVSTLNSTAPFCLEEDSNFLKQLLYWLTDNGFVFDLSKGSE